MASKLEKFYEERGLKKGMTVIVLTREGNHGQIRQLYFYATGASWDSSGLTRDGIKHTTTYESWNGMEPVSFYNGD